MKAMLRFDVADVMPQPNALDCGLFARANATELVHGHNPVMCVWNTKELEGTWLRILKEEA